MVVGKEHKILQATSNNLDCCSILSGFRSQLHAFIRFEYHSEIQCYRFLLLLCSQKNSLWYASLPTLERWLTVGAVK